MKAYRITRKKYANDLTGYGSQVTGGRWNSKGKSLLYTASSRSLALLEILVHLPSIDIAKDFATVEIDIPDDLLITKIDSSILPQNWNSYSTAELTKSIGDNWLENNLAVALRVPSTIVKDEFNYLINPSNPGFGRVRICAITTTNVDGRLVRDEKIVIKNDPIIQRRVDLISKFKYDVFISHAHEDKESVVIPIVNEINKYGLRYWYDREQLRIGDSIVKKINSGINESRFVLAIISSAFVSKNWTMTEFQTALNMQISSDNLKVLPILVVRNNDKEYILSKISYLRDLVYVIWEDNPGYIANMIAERLND